MILYINLATCAILCLILAFHILSAFLEGRIASLLAYVNIALHIALAVLLYYASASLTLLSLVFMVSILVLAASNLAAARLRRRKEDSSVDL